MSAELLREAASKMRERAEDARAGTWERVGTRVISPRQYGYEEVAQATGSLPEGLVLNAAHIASWHPAVALAVADWLDACAEFIESNPGFTWDGEDHALNIARAYLGSDR